MSLASFSIVHFHFHRRKTGVTKSLEQLLPHLNTKGKTAVFGYGISANKIGFRRLMSLLFSAQKTVVHVHRNNEMLFALLLRLLGGRFSLFATRHSATPPSSLTRFLMQQADRRVFLTNDAPFDRSPKNNIIPHGVDLKHFAATSRPLEEKKQIGVVGRIRKAKGQKVVMNAVAPFLTTHPDWNLCFIGAVDQKKYAREIEAIAKEKALSNQVSFLEQTERIQDFYSRCALIVVASFSEGFSLVPLEAIACGVTVIATENVGVHSALISHGKNGYLFPPGNEKQLAEIIHEIVEKASYFSASDLRNSIKDWDIAAIAQQTRLAYQEEIAEG